ncbi:MAG TPA: sulfite exporter TauE/SafE family protein [Thermoanaerobaculia bacterium]|nr:sulfite exporter TauE/SafE family protein [Thermoanaerobaculia bacterium]
MPTTLVLAIVVAAAVSLAVRHVLGFGFSLTFVPLASFFLPTRQAVLTAIVLEIALGAALAVELRRDLRLRDSLQLQAASLLGIAAGIGALRVLPQALLFKLSLLPLLALAAVLCVRPTLATARSRPKLVGAGLLSGALNVWASFSGPPVALYYLATETSTKSIKGLLTGYFLVLYLFTAAGLVLDGEYLRFAGWPIVLTAICTIAVLYPLSKILARAAEPWFRKLAAWFLLLVAVAALLKDFH